MYNQKKLESRPGIKTRDNTREDRDYLKTDSNNQTKSKNISIVCKTLSNLTRWAFHILSVSSASQWQFIWNVLCLSGELQPVSWTRPSRGAPDHIWTGLHCVCHLRSQTHGPRRLRRPRHRLCCSCWPLICCKCLAAAPHGSILKAHFKVAFIWRCRDKDQQKKDCVWVETGQQRTVKHSSCRKEEQVHNSFYSLVCVCVFFFSSVQTHKWFFFFFYWMLPLPSNYSLGLLWAL